MLIFDACELQIRTNKEYEILTNEVLKSQFDESKTIGKQGNHIMSSQIVISRYIDKTNAPEIL